MVNKVILIGNLGRDPELRATQSGQAIATISVATSRRWKDDNGQKQEQTEWHTVVIWGRQAEIAGQYLRRGGQVYIEGRLQTRTWEDKNTGEKRYKTEVVCHDFKMLGNRSGGDGGEGQYGGPAGHRFGRGDQRSPQGDYGDEQHFAGGSGNYADWSGSAPDPSDDDIPF